MAQTAIEMLAECLRLRHKEAYNDMYEDIETYYKQIEKQQQIDFATDFAKDYIGFDSVSTDPNAASPAEIYYNQIKK